MDNVSDNRVRTLSLLIKNQMNSTSIHHIVIRLYWPRGKIMNNEETEKRLKNIEDLLFRLVRLKESEMKTEEETFPSNNGEYQHITRMEYLELGRVESQ